MKEVIVNGRPIRVCEELMMVTVLKNPNGSIFGTALPIADKSFHAPQDGSLAECYQKAMAYANECTD